MSVNVWTQAVVASFLSASGGGGGPVEPPAEEGLGMYLVQDNPYMLVASADNTMSGDKLEISVWLSFRGIVEQTYLIAHGTDTYLQINTDGTMRMRVESADGTVGYDRIPAERVSFYGLTHIYFQYDRIAGTAEFRIDGNIIDASGGTTFTAATTLADIDLGGDLDLFALNNSFRDFEGAFKDLWIDTPTTFLGHSNFIDANGEPTTLSGTPDIWLGGSQTAADINGGGNNGTQTITMGTGTDPFVDYDLPGSFALKTTVGTSISSGDSPFTVSAPPKVAAEGDLLLAIVCSDKSSNGNNITTPTGWTLDFHDANSTQDVLVNIYSRLAPASEIETVDFAVSGISSFDYLASFLVFDGHDEVEVVGTSVNASSDTAVAPGITTLTDNTQVFAVFAIDGGDNIPVLSVPIGWEVVMQGAPIAASSDVGVAILRKTVASAGSSGDCSVQFSGSDGIIGVQIGVKPAAPVVVESHRYWRVRFTDIYDFDFGSLAEVKMATSIGGADITTTGQAISGHARSGFADTNAFDNDVSTFWSFDENQSDANWWVGQDFGTDVTVAEVKLTGRNDGFVEHGPAGWVLEYSDNGTDWTTHWTYDREAPWDTGEERTYTSDQPALDETAATHWRVFGSYSDNASYLHIAELQMSETTGGSFSDETTTGAAISGQARSGFPATEAFDDTVSGNNSWGADKGTPGTMWVGQAFASAKDVQEIKITARADSFEEQAPRTFAVQKSLDSGATWITVWVHGRKDDAADGLGPWTSSEERTYTKP